MRAIKFLLMNVGTGSLASFLIVTPEGNILINSAYEATVPVIRDSVQKLGFRFSDTKILGSQTPPRSRK